MPSEVEIPDGFNILVTGGQGNLELTRVTIRESAGGSITPKCLELSVTEAAKYTISTVGPKFAAKVQTNQKVAAGESSQRIGPDSLTNGNGATMRRTILQRLSSSASTIGPGWTPLSATSIERSVYAGQEQEKKGASV